ncbi:MAG: transglutaminase domain-containing protein, partial [Calditrichia bacterium]|nr:transglutaminase domain-containing protein [Calditrichia bacterium]
KEKVDEILKGKAKTEMDSISLLTHWVADEVRYSGISMGPGEGFTLHKGDMTFLDRCGVCKDKAGMLVTMLRAAGFESYPAMTMAGSRIDYIPADQFNHSVTLVKLSDGKYHLLDPTWVPFVRELWSSLEQQQQYLPGPPEGADLATTPISAPENHFYKINAKSQLLDNGTLKGKFIVTLEGQADAAFRRYFVSVFKAQWLSTFERILLQTSPEMVIEKFDYHHDPYDHSVPIKLTVQYSIPNFATVTKEEIIFIPLLAQKIFYTYRMNDQYFMNTGLEERKYPFRTRCSKLIELNEEIKLPQYKNAVYLPEVENISGDGADFKGGYTLKGRTLKLHEKMVLKKRIYQPEDWNSYRKSVLAQDKLSKEKVILKK